MGFVFQFAQFELDVPAYALRRAGKTVRLEKIPMELLILLVQRAGTLVERSEIRMQLWGSDVFVEHDAAINTAIRKIRHALGDEPAAPVFVETVVGKGYKFIAPVEHLTSLSHPDDSAAGGDAGQSSPGLRVFPRFSVTIREQEFVLQSRQTVLGRDPSAGVCVDHPSVSRRHARISIESDKAILEDLGSRNGTFLNGRRIDGPVTVHDKSVIGLGPFTLIFSIVREPASTQSMSAGKPVE
jgi:DNA-binding winged helix-turn-helix (wHTH) protein